ncbi:XrtB/PEP-CTERM-associated polysaccharide biosynthesis outer membrane protein EpsL, partial [Nitrosomonas sp.]|uniref:XrtB/PEP-CTERM-associated polysaccharide biosynthesis outer membrane protein EpsL n=1 Tax=Nitrosomonas sp. TaxID=42353 RepID=UPI002731AB78
TRNLFDMSHRFTGGLMFEKEISRQRLTANLNWTHTSFEKFNQMDNDLKSLNGNWNWFLGNRLEGNMGASYVQSLAPFLFQPGVKNIRTEQTEFINAIWRFHPSWNLNGRYTRYDLNTDSPNDRMRFLNRTEDRFEGGIDYVTSSGNTVGVLFRDILGNFPALVRAPDGSFTDNSYDQKEVMAKINWMVSEKSRFYGTGGWVERKNASFTQRDFSGFNARILYEWQPTSKVGLTVNGWRETSSMQALTASFSLNTGASIIPSWNITQKVRLEGIFSYETRNFSSFAIRTDEILPLGIHNTLRNAAIKLIYNPYLGLQLSASVYNNHLKSDTAFGGFSANGANINLQYTYGRR